MKAVPDPFGDDPAFKAPEQLLLTIQPVDQSSIRVIDGGNLRQRGPGQFGEDLRRGKDQPVRGDEAVKTICLGLLRLDRQQLKDAARRKAQFRVVRGVEILHRDLLVAGRFQPEQPEKLVLCRARRRRDHGK
ncbi:hypothetical protein D3C80_1194730 [compost metagenome]